ncbi:PREDICTED: reverse mRNAase [Prunus dulcis]|uniref:PREDICTED: reverse mRNAase n=1 Tax=Prunus dulcis TaxID=3755 RepID=A0A5E4FMG9_PRUDU|nr:PREDICTED: reverse mRNAase [Prunus dulcis]
MEEDGLGSDHVLRLFKKRRFSTEDEGHTTTAPMGKRPGETHKCLLVSVWGSGTQEVLTKLPETMIVEKALVDYIAVEQLLGLPLFSKGKEQIGSRGLYGGRCLIKKRATKGYRPRREGGQGKGEVMLQKQKTSQAGWAACFKVSRVGLSGGLALLLQYGMDIMICSSLPGHIDAIFGGLEPTAFRFTSFHGNPYIRIHKHLWDLIQRIAGDVIGPWLVGGDFNEIVAAHRYLHRRFLAMS